ncbi:MAG TPA: tetratricopeptide repeat protein [Pyrinomonadaceae bacterium]|nr:tetratricopeptide repeat protein [Pyrinomonadaceae bacterium]
MKITLILLVCLFVQVGTDLAQTNDELLTRAKVAIEKREYDSAITDLTAVINSQPKNDEAYAQRARAYFLKTNYDDAAFADAEKSLKINSKNVDALNIRGKVKVNRKQIDSALDDFNKAVKINPNFVKPFLNRAEVMIGKNEFDKAIADYTLVLQIDSKNIAAIQGRALVYLNKRKDYANALADFNKLTELSPTVASYYTYRGRSYQLLNDPEHALADFNKSIELNPKYYLSYFYRGNLYYVKTNYDAALSDYFKALELEPKDFGANYNLGLVYQAQKKYDAAIAELNKIPSDNSVYSLAKTQIDEINQIIANEKFAATLNMASEPFKALFDPHGDSSSERVRIKALTPFDDPNKTYTYIGSYSFIQPVGRMITGQLALSLSGGETGGHRFLDNDENFFLQKVDEINYSDTKIQFKIKEPRNHHYTVDVAYQKPKEGSEIDLHTLDTKYLRYDNRWDLTNKILFFFGNSICFNIFIPDVSDENNQPLTQNKDFINFYPTWGGFEFRVMGFANYDDGKKAFEAILASLRKNLDASKFLIRDQRQENGGMRNIRIESKIIKVGVPNVNIELKAVDGKVWLELKSS